MLKELWTLVKMLFTSKPSEITEVKIIDMEHFPFKGYKAMAWCGHIIHRIGTSEVDQKTITHEIVHLNRAKLYGSWISYYLNYLWEWIKGNPIIAPASSAYYTNPHEIEAYANEDNEGYIPTEESFKKYFIKDRKATYKAFRDNWKDYCKQLNIKES